MKNQDVQAILNEYGGLDYFKEDADEKPAWETMKELSELLGTTEDDEDKAEIQEVMGIIFKGAQESLFQYAEDEDEVNAIAQKWTRFDDPEEPVMLLLAKAHNFDPERHIRVKFEFLIRNMISNQADTLAKLRKRKCSERAFEGIEDMLEDEWSGVTHGVNEALDRALEKAKDDHPEMKQILDAVDVPYLSQTYTDIKAKRARTDDFI
jgi:hypothetical protein